MSYKVFLAYMSMSCSVFPTNLRKLENWSTKKETAAPPHPHPPKPKYLQQIAQSHVSLKDESWEKSSVQIS